MNSIHCLSALALAACASGASAQSSVTLGGRLDVGPQYIDNGSTKIKRIDSGTYTASRLIMRGEEDLGGGLRALFYLENRFNADTGEPQSATKFWNAGSYVGLGSTSLGTLTMGRQYVPIFWSFLFADETGPHRLHGYSAVQSVQRSSFARVAAAASPITTAASLDSVAGGTYALSSTSAFEDNLVVYKSPAFAGTTVMLATSAAEGTAGNDGKVYGANVEHRTGGFYGSVAYNQKRGATSSTGLRKTMREVLVSANYAITPDLKVWGNVHPWRLEQPGAELKGRDGMLGVSYRMGVGQVWVNYARKKIDDCAACDSSGFGVGYHHSLSKRTELYVAYGQVNNQGNAGTTLNGVAPANFGQSVRGVAGGIAHVF